MGSGPTIRYIAAGDSTAVGEGSSDTEHTYPFKIAITLARKNTILYRNISVVGFTSRDVLEEQIDQIIVFKPDIVTISMGANDATFLFNSSIFRGAKLVTYPDSFLILIKAFQNLSIALRR